MQVMINNNTASDDNNNNNNEDEKESKDPKHEENGVESIHVERCNINIEDLPVDCFVSVCLLLNTNEFYLLSKTNKILSAQCNKIQQNFGNQLKKQVWIKDCKKLMGAIYWHEIMMHNNVYDNHIDWVMLYRELVVLTKKRKMRDFSAIQGITGAHGNDNNNNEDNRDNEDTVEDTYGMGDLKYQTCKYDCPQLFYLLKNRYLGLNDNRSDDDFMNSYFSLYKYCNDAPLHVACCFGSIKMVRLLLSLCIGDEYIRKPQKMTDNSPLLVAIRANEYQCCETLILYHQQIGKFTHNNTSCIDDESFIEACEQIKVSGKLVQLMIENGVDWNDRNNEALLSCIISLRKQNNEEDKSWAKKFFNVLLDNYHDSVSGLLFLFFMTTRDFDLFIMLMSKIEYDIDRYIMKCDEEGLNVFGHAAMNVQFDTMNYIYHFVKKRYGSESVAALINKQNHQGKTAYHFVCEKGDIVSIKKFIGDYSPYLDITILNNRGKHGSDCIFYSNKCKQKIQNLENKAIKEKEKGKQKETN